MPYVIYRFHWVAVAHSSHNRRAHFPQPSCAQVAGATRIEHHCGTLKRNGKNQRHHDSSADTAPTFPVQWASLFLPRIFLGTASGQFLRPAASRLLLSRFRPYTVGFPPGKQPLALEAAALAFGCPRKMGQKKRKQNVTWNSFGLRLPADVSDIRAWLVLRW